MTSFVSGERERFAGGRARGLARALAVALLACGCGGGSRSGDTTIRFQLTTAEDVAGLASVRLTAGSSAKTYRGAEPVGHGEVFDLPVPSSVTGSVDVGALARPASGCMGYGGTAVAYIAGAGSVATVTILMTPQDICETTGTGGTGGRPARRERAARRDERDGGHERHHGDGRLDLDRIGGNRRLGIHRHRGNRRRDGRHDGRRRNVRAGRNDRLRRCDRRNERDDRHRAGVAAPVAAREPAGRLREPAAAPARRHGRHGGRRGAVAAAVGRAAAAARPVAASRSAAGPRAVAPPSLSRCIEYSQNDPGATCNTTTNANNPFIYDVAVSPDGQYLATAGSHRTSTPNATDAANDRVRIWRLVGNTPTLCGSINISNPGMGPAYVAFSPNGQYLAVAWRRDYVYVYSVPGFTMVGSILSSYGPLYGVGFSPDSQTVFSIDYDSTLADGTLYADRVNGDPVTLAQLGVDPDVLAVSPVAGTGNTSTIAVGGLRRHRRRLRLQRHDDLRRRRS